MQLSNYPPGVSGFEDAITGGESSWYEVNIERLADDGLAINEWLANAFEVTERGSSESIASASGGSLAQVLAEIAEGLEAYQKEKP